MGAAESKMRFKTNVFKLANSRDIPAENAYWSMFWKEPESANDIFEIMTSADIRTIRDSNTTNFLTLVRIISVRLSFLANSKEFPSPNAPTKELLNCVRLLTRLLPLVYELPSLSEREKSIFWSTELKKDDAEQSVAGSSSRPSHPVGPIAINHSHTNGISSQNNLDGSKLSSADETPLGAKLIRSCGNLLFMKNFTIESHKKPNDNSSGIEYSIWEPGISSNEEFKNPKTEIDTNRLEILRLMLVLFSQCIYTTPSKLASSGSRYLTCFVSTTARIEIIALLCSLINTTCRISRAPVESGLIFHNSSLSELRHLTVTYSVQLLTLLVAYPIPKDTEFLKNIGLLSGPPQNIARLYFGKIHKDNELILLESSLINILKKPILSTLESESSAFGLIKASNKSNDPSIWSTEVVMLLWELFQCNRQFRSHAGEKIGAELVIVLLYYIFNYRNVEHYSSFVRICSYFLLYLSSDSTITSKILLPFDNNLYNSLPLHFKTNTSPITYRDFIITQTCQMLNNDNNGHILTPTFVEWLYNLVPIASSQESAITNNNTISRPTRNPGGGLSYQACSSLTQLVVKYSTHGFLSASPINSDLLALVLRSICHAIVRHPRPSRTLIYTIITNQRIYDQVLSTINGFNINRNTKKYGNDTAIGDSFQNLSLGNRPDNRSRTASITSIESNDSYNAAAKNSTGAASDEYDIDESVLRPKQPPGMSPRAKGKLPLNAPLKRGWGGMDALKTILKLIPLIKSQTPDIEGRASDISVILNNIENLNFDEIYGSISVRNFSPETKLEQLKFVWSAMSLGWYESILWGCIYNSNELCKNSKIMNNLTNSISSFSKFSSDWGFKGWSNNETTTIDLANQSLTNINIWNNTDVKLFRIRSQNGVFPGLIQATGAVDMANSLVRRFSDFRRNRNSVTSINSNSVPSTPTEEQAGQFKLVHRNSLTPRNSFSRPTPQNTFDESPV